MTDPRDVLTGSPYRGYVYAYPHKTAYRRLPEPRPLRDVWKDEDRRSLFLYVHVPFCTMRCGFCNLFTQPQPADGLAKLYLDALAVEARRVREALPDATFARFAIGGGTPTFLSESELATVFDLAGRVMGADATAIPVGVETSPDTMSPGKIAVLKARGVDRVSIGVQSFVESETAASGRPQKTADVVAALDRLKSAAFGTLNIDLIYGLPGQTLDTWRTSLRAALAFRPEELYLYPLYVRPLTGLGKSRKSWDDVRLACYREARDTLLAEGYSQVSMRMFRRTDAPDSGGPAYCCQTDGMVGLGVGARSYTRNLHYSSEYAVGAKGVKAIVGNYLAREEPDFDAVAHGFALDEAEQRRRFVLQSLLNREGLDGAEYFARFGTKADADFPELRAFVEMGLLVCNPSPQPPPRSGEGEPDGFSSPLRFGEGPGEGLPLPVRWLPTPLGLERSDALGPWFFSAAVRRLMAEYDAR